MAGAGDEPHVRDPELTEGAFIVDDYHGRQVGEACSRRGLLAWAGKALVALFGVGVAVSLLGKEALADRSCTWLPDNPNVRCDLQTWCSDGRDCFQFYNVYVEWCCWGPSDCYYSGRKLFEPNGCCWC